MRRSANSRLPASQNSARPQHTKSSDPTPSAFRGLRAHPRRRHGPSRQRGSPPCAPAAHRPRVIVLTLSICAARSRTLGHRRTRYQVQHRCDGVSGCRGQAVDFVVSVQALLRAWSCLHREPSTSRRHGSRPRRRSSGFALQRRQAEPLLLRLRTTRLSSSRAPRL